MSNPSRVFTERRLRIYATDRTGVGWAVTVEQTHLPGRGWSPIVFLAVGAGDPEPHHLPMSDDDAQHVENVEQWTINVAAWLLALDAEGVAS